VSDSYDIRKAVQKIWGRDLRDAVRASGGTLVVRPDSGDPVETPIQVIEGLAEAFGTSTNGKGFRVLADCVRVIQGDGIVPQQIEDILTRLEAKGYSAENIAFGMGAGLLQKVDRDTYSFAMKANARLDADNVWNDVYKRPATMRSKSSKAGRQAVVSIDGDLQAARLEDVAAENNLLQPVWENGRLLVDQSFDDIRARAQ